MCFSEQFETGITAEQYIDFDHELTSTQGKLSDPNILLEAMSSRKRFLER